jgi:cleavage and polyadenylation specificity factor subunit 4
VDDVFDEVDDHGEDLLPSSLSDLLTPTERARRMSRTDSREGVAGSPSNLINPNQYGGAERLAQSASAAIPAGNFLEALWSKDGGDARKDPEGEQPVAVESGSSTPPATADLTFTSAQPQPSLRQSLLSQQRTPSSPGVNIRQNPVAPAVDAPYLMRERTDPSSPTTRALQEHAPGQSLPGGIAAALSRMHMQPRTSSGLANEKTGLGPVPSVRREDHDAHDEEALFDMDG